MKAIQDEYIGYEEWLDKMQQISGINDVQLPQPQPIDPELEALLNDILKGE